MQTTLIFRGKLKDTGEIVEHLAPVTSQEILQDPRKLDLLIQNTLFQLGAFGIVRREGNTLILTPGSRFEEISCVIVSYPKVKNKKSVKALWLADNFKWVDSIDCARRFWDEELCYGLVNNLKNPTTSHKDPIVEEVTEDDEQ